MEGDKPFGRNNLAQNSPEEEKNIYRRINIPEDGNDNSKKSSQREKINSIMILVVGIFALGFGYYQLTSNISNPFSFLGKTKSINSTTTDSQQLAINALKSQDIDGDGLSDYDESYVYKTSPYLSDSDGDGIGDGQEIKQGTDPNCPEGKTCFGTASTGSASSTGSIPTFQGTPPTGSNSQIDVATLRKAMVQGGLSQAEVDAMSDDDITSAYQQVLAANPDLASKIGGANLSQSSTTIASSSSSTTVGVSTLPKTVDVSGLNIKSLDDLKTLTGAQIKALMIKNGASPTLLNTVSDDELKQMFLDKLNSTAQ